MFCLIILQPGRLSKILVVLAPCIASILKCKWVLLLFFVSVSMSKCVSNNYREGIAYFQHDNMQKQLDVTSKWHV